MTGDNGTWPEPAVDYVQAIADTKLLLGHRYGERMASGQSIEDDVANMNLAQEEFGHVRQLFTLLEAQGRSRVWLEHERDPSAFSNASVLDAPAADWPEFIVGMGLVDRAAWLMLDAVDHDDVRGIAQKVAQEEYFHLARADGWLTQLAEEDPEGLVDVLADVLPGVLAFVGPATYDADTDPVFRSGFTERPVAAVRQRLLDHLTGQLAGTDVDLDAVNTDGPAPGDWNEQRRRVDGGSIAAETAEVIQGVRSREFAIE